MAQKSYPVTTYRFILLIIGLTGLLMRGLLGETNVVTIILFIIQLVALDLILKESNIFSTVYYRFILICISFYIVGALFIIMHWQGGIMLLTVAVSGVVITYITRTIHKSPIHFRYCKMRLGYQRVFYHHCKVDAFAICRYWQLYKSRIVWCDVVIIFPLSC